MRGGTSRTQRNGVTRPSRSVRQRGEGAVARRRARRRRQHHVAQGAGAALRAALHGLLAAGRAGESRGRRSPSAPVRARPRPSGPRSALVAGVPALPAGGPARGRQPRHRQAQADPRRNRRRPQVWATTASAKGRREPLYLSAGSIVTEPKSRYLNSSTVPSAVF